MAVRDEKEHVRPALALTSENVNTCPIDRKTFNIILARSGSGEGITRKVIVGRPSAPKQEEPEEDVTLCEVCGTDDREDRLLLCDSCDAGYHLDCLNPPLNAVPLEEWFCPDCIEINASHLATTLDPDEINQLLGDAEDLLDPNLPTLRPLQRVIPRTRQSERVRNRIGRNREVRAQVIREAPVGIDHGQCWASKEEKKPDLNQKKEKPNTWEESKEKKSNKRKGKSKKLQEYQEEKNKSNFGRILPRAKALSSAAWGPGSVTSDTTFSSTRILTHRSAAPHLSIFGSRNELDWVPEQAEEGQSMALGHGETQILTSHSDVRHPLNRVQRFKTEPASGDLLGSLLETQENFLLATSSDIMIHRDGTVKPRPKKSFTNQAGSQNHTRSAPMFSSSGQEPPHSYSHGSQSQQSSVRISSHITQSGTSHVPSGVLGNIPLPPSREDDVDLYSDMEIQPSDDESNESENEKQESRLTNSQTESGVGSDGEDEFHMIIDLPEPPKPPSFSTSLEEDSSQPLRTPSPDLDIALPPDPEDNFPISKDVDNRGEAGDVSNLHEIPIPEGQSIPVNAVEIPLPMENSSSDISLSEAPMSTSRIKQLATVAMKPVGGVKVSLKMKPTRLQVHEIFRVAKKSLYDELSQSKDVGKSSASLNKELKLSLKEGNGKNQKEEGRKGTSKAHDDSRNEVDSEEEETSVETEQSRKQIEEEGTGSRQESNKQSGSFCDVAVESVSDGDMELDKDQRDGNVGFLEGTESISDEIEGIESISDGNLEGNEGRGLEEGEIEEEEKRGHTKKVKRGKRKKHDHEDRRMRKIFTKNIKDKETDTPPFTTKDVESIDDVIQEKAYTQDEELKEGDSTWKKPSISTRGRVYRDGKQQDEDTYFLDQDSSKIPGKKGEENKENKVTRHNKRKEDLARYDVRRLIRDRPHSHDHKRRQSPQGFNEEPYEKEHEYPSYYEDFSADFEEVSPYQYEHHDKGMEDLAQSFYPQQCHNRSKGHKRSPSHSLSSEHKHGIHKSRSSSRSKSNSKKTPTRSSHRTSASPHHRAHSQQRHKHSHSPTAEQRQRSSKKCKSESSPGRKAQKKPSASSKRGRKRSLSPQKRKTHRRQRHDSSSSQGKSSSRSSSSSSSSTSLSLSLSPSPARRSGQRVKDRTFSSRKKRNVTPPLNEFNHTEKNSEEKIKKRKKKKQSDSSSKEQPEGKKKAKRMTALQTSQGIMLETKTAPWDQLVIDVQNKKDGHEEKQTKRKVTERKVSIRPSHVIAFRTETEFRTAPWEQIVIDSQKKKDAQSEGKKRKRKKKDDSDYEDEKNRKSSQRGPVGPIEVIDVSDGETADDEIEVLSDIRRYKLESSKPIVSWKSQSDFKQDATNSVRFSLGVSKRGALQNVSNPLASPDEEEEIPEPEEPLQEASSKSPSPQGSQSNDKTESETRRESELSRDVAPVIDRIFSPLPSEDRANDDTYNPFEPTNSPSPKQSSTLMDNQLSSPKRRSPSLRLEDRTHEERVDTAAVSEEPAIELAQDQGTSTRTEDREQIISQDAESQSDRLEPVIQVPLLSPALPLSNPPAPPLSSPAFSLANPPEPPAFTSPLMPPSIEPQSLFASGPPQPPSFSSTLTPSATKGNLSSILQAHAISLNEAMHEAPDPSTEDNGVQIPLSTPSSEANSFPTSAKKAMPFPPISGMKNILETLTLLSPTKKPKLRKKKKQVVDKFKNLFGSQSPVRKQAQPKKARTHLGKKKVEVFGEGKPADWNQVFVMEELPNSAVEMQVKQKYLKKVNRQERVVEEVKVVLKPFYTRREVDKEMYKEVLRKCVPKICHNKSGEINPMKIRMLVEGYVAKVKHQRKKETRDAAKALKL
ncbi:unnamed protein product [Darwinula stevensoni]|uniref:PHD-type domain-containing protein n=1 Tax=Darwinula stevensoni TaxID=69355 RepID=A0A7R9A9K6_9CRUS|nr:unnamed protein product [Darwinula stevensoni]CAG0897493.1 unnamed protein product [Darwinula stevensoni]